MDKSTRESLDDFLGDIGFPIDKQGLVSESHEFPLSITVREAIALLPDKEYTSRAELRAELIGLSDDETPKKDQDAMELEDEDDKPDEIVNLEEFTQMGDEEDHESV